MLPSSSACVVSKITHENKLTPGDVQQNRACGGGCRGTCKRERVCVALRYEELDFDYIYLHIVSPLQFRAAAHPFSPLKRGRERARERESARERERGRESHYQYIYIYIARIVGSNLVQYLFAMQPESRLCNKLLVLCILSHTYSPPVLPGEFFWFV